MMKTCRLPLWVVMFAAAAGTATAQAGVGAQAQFHGADGAAMGSAELRESSAGVLIRLDLHGLAPGWHGIHVHEKGDCADPKFQTAGGHMHPAGAKPAHGLLSPAGPESGDLPNIYVPADGNGRAELFTDRVSLRGEGGRPALLDADGSSLVIHDKPDDHMSQPIGGAGARVACAVIH